MERRVNLICLIVMVMLMGAAAARPARVNKVPNTKFHYYNERLRRNLLANNLGATPPMGWNSWNHFGCNVNESIIKDAADAMVSSGLAQLGYSYINIDDCWGEKVRDENGNLVAKNTTFPSGIKALADYVHGRGLKLGIYSSAGYYTCAQTMPGSLGFEEQDAKTFASWGIDYLKYDNCYNDGTKPTVRYPVMTRALMKAGRPIYFSICEWGDMHPALWGFQVGNSWRTTGDINDNYESMMTRAGLNNDYAEYARPGGWNDPDMLEIGNGGMSKEQYIIHFSLWAMIKAPLLLGCDLVNMSPDTLEIISNKEVIAINQDPLGVQAKKVREDVELWAGPLSGYRFVALIVNGMNYPSNLTVHISDIGIPPNSTVQVRDLWEHKTLDEAVTENLTATVGPYSCKMFLLTPITGRAT